MCTRSFQHPFLIKAIEKENSQKRFFPMLLMMVVEVVLFLNIEAVISVWSQLSIKIETPQITVTKSKNLYFFRLAYHKVSLSVAYFQEDNRRLWWTDLSHRRDSKGYVSEFKFNLPIWCHLYYSLYPEGLSNRKPWFIQRICLVDTDFNGNTAEFLPQHYSFQTVSAWSSLQMFYFPICTVKHSSIVD